MNATGCTATVPATATVPVPGVDAVLFDRDGTLVEDVPYNGDPAQVRLLPGAREAVERLRAAGVRVGLLTNQSGIGRGFVTAAAVRRVNERVGALVGGFDAVAMCPHTPGAGCPCRKPSPLLVHRLAEALGTTADRCLVVGDRATDMEAAHAAGARGALVDGAGALARIVDDVLEGGAA